MGIWDWIFVTFAGSVISLSIAYCIYRIIYLPNRYKNFYTKLQGGKELFQLLSEKDQAIAEKKYYETILDEIADTIDKLNYCPYDAVSEELSRYKTNYAAYLRNARAISEKIQEVNTQIRQITNNLPKKYMEYKLFYEYYSNRIGGNR